MLSDNQVLILEDLRILRRESIQDLLKSIFDLQWKVSKYKFILYHKFFNTLVGHLNLEWEVVFDRRHLCQLHKLL